MTLSPERFMLVAAGATMVVVTAAGVRPVALGLPNTGLSSSTVMRVVTYSFVHASAAHLLSNLLIGSLLARLAWRNDARTQLLVSGSVAGALAGAVAFVVLINGGDRLLVGASALVAGQIGACVVARHRIGVRMTTPWLLLLLGVLAPFGGPSTLVAHVGGFIGGCAVGARAARAPVAGTSGSAGAI